MKTNLDTYYEFRRRHATVRGKQHTFFTRRALGRWKDLATPTLLLAETMDLPADARVLNLHCGNGLLVRHEALALQPLHALLQSGGVLIAFGRERCHKACCDRQKRPRQASPCTPK